MVIFAWTFVKIKANVFQIVIFIKYATIISSTVYVTELLLCNESSELLVFSYTRIAIVDFNHDYRLVLNIPT